MGRPHGASKRNDVYEYTSVVVNPQDTEDIN